MESSPETARQYIQTRDLPSQDGVPDYPQEAERGLGPLQWWQIYGACLSFHCQYPVVSTFVCSTRATSVDGKREALE